MHVDDWMGLYREGWGKRLRPASFAHPAKCSYGLSKRIYEHALEEGWVKPGDYLVDIFAGVGGFALEAMRHGLHFVGVELEQRFVDNGQGCDCTGVNKADWVRFQGRWGKARYRDGRHWCPECIMRAGTVANERKFKVAEKRKIEPLPLPGTKWGALAKTRQATIFDAMPTASYVRNSGKIPCTELHHYRGNIETWAAQGMPGTAVIVQGDSRRLGEVLAEARICVSSPPYAGCESTRDEKFWRKHIEDIGRNPETGGARSLLGAYSDNPANLGNLPDTGFEAALGDGGTHDPGPQRDDGTNHEGDFSGGHCPPLPQDGGTAGLQAALAVASPAFPDGGMGDKRFGGGLKDKSIIEASKVGGGGSTYYGDQPGQLAQMPEGSFDLALSSPVYIGNTASDDPDKRGGLYRDPKRRSDKTLTATYSENKAQLAQMPEGDLALALGSPPYIGTAVEKSSKGVNLQKQYETYRSQGGGASFQAFCKTQARHSQGYGTADGQLAALPEGDHAEACERPAIAISSPPFGAAEIRNRTPFQGGRVAAMMKDAYTQDKQGTSPGQLAQMPPGDHAAALEAGAETGGAELCLSSPPYEGSINAGRNDDNARRRKAERHARGEFDCKRPDVFTSQSNVGARGMFDSHYGDTEGQIGKETGSTFWAASREILEQVYQVLAPGAHAIWVLKAFVRSGRLVDFPGQWESLCQSVGFETVCKHRAWLNKNSGIVQTTWDGDEVSMEKWYKSFFRILCEKKGAPRIDFETVLCMEKPQ